MLTRLLNQNLNFKEFLFIHYPKIKGESEVIPIDDFIQWTCFISKPTLGIESQTNKPLQRIHSLGIQIIKYEGFYLHTFLHFPYLPT